MSKYKCAECNNRADFFVSQPTIPQQLADGTKETSPAARSALTCGVHLSMTLRRLTNLPFAINLPTVKVFK